MFRTHISVVERLGFFGGQGEDLFNARGIRDVADHLLIGPGADLLFDFHADGLEIEAELLQDIDSDALAQLNQAKQEVFGSDEVVVETVSFLTRQCEDLLGSGRKVVHGFFAHNYSLKCNHCHCLSNPAPGPGGGREIGRLTGLRRSRTMSARSKSRSSALSFSECCFCRWAGCVKMNNSSTKDLSTPGKRPTSTPRRMRDR